MSRQLGESRHIRVVAHQAQLDAWWPSFENSIGKYPVIGLNCKWNRTGLGPRQGRSWGRTAVAVEEEDEWDADPGFAYEGDYTSAQDPGGAAARRRERGGGGLGLVAVASFGGHVLLIRTPFFGELPARLAALLGGPRVFKLGQGLERDRSRLNDLHGVFLSNLVDVRLGLLDWPYVAAHWEEPTTFGVRSFSRWLLKAQPLEAPLAPDWLALRLSRQQIAYAAQEVQLYVDALTLARLRDFGWVLPRDWIRSDDFGRAMYLWLAPLMNKSFHSANRANPVPLRDAAPTAAKAQLLRGIQARIRSDILGTFSRVSVWATPFPTQAAAVEAMLGRETSVCNRWPAIFATLPVLLDAPQPLVLQGRVSLGSGLGQLRYSLRVVVREVRTGGGSGGGSALDLDSAFAASDSEETRVATARIARLKPRIEAAATKKVKFISEQMAWNTARLAVPSPLHPALPHWADDVRTRLTAPAKSPQVKMFPLGLRSGPPRPPRRRLGEKAKARGALNDMEFLGLSQAGLLAGASPGMAEGVLPWHAPQAWSADQEPGSPLPIPTAAGKLVWEHDGSGDTFPASTPTSAQLNSATQSTRGGVGWDRRGGTKNGCGSGGGGGFQRDAAPRGGFRRGGPGPVAPRYQRQAPLPTPEIPPVRPSSSLHQHLAPPSPSQPHPRPIPKSDFRAPSSSFGNPGGMGGFTTLAQPTQNIRPPHFNRFPQNGGPDKGGFSESGCGGSGGGGEWGGGLRSAGPLRGASSGGGGGGGGWTGGAPSSFAKDTRPHWDAGSFRGRGVSSFSGRRGMDGGGAGGFGNAGGGFAALGNRGSCLGGGGGREDGGGRWEGRGGGGGPRPWLGRGIRGRGGGGGFASRGEQRGGRCQDTGFHRPSGMGGFGRSGLAPLQSGGFEESERGDPCNEPAGGLFFGDAGAHNEHYPSSF